MTQEKHFDSEQENEKLRSEIVRLREHLEQEEFLKKKVYKQWSELHALILAKESDLKLLKSTNLLYKCSLYLILFLIAPGYYFITSGKAGDEKLVTNSQTDSARTLTAYQTPTSNSALTQLPEIKPEEKQKEKIQPDAIKPKTTTATKPIIEKPLDDSIRNYIYWEGWSAYYEKLNNPYKKSTQKYEVWLAGWSEGANDAKKILAKNPPAQ